MRTHVLRNPASQRGRSADSVSAHLATLSSAHQIVDLTGDDAESSARALGQAVAVGEIERLVIFGGDGLVNLAIQQIAHRDIETMIIPVGSGNDFATALGLADSLEASWPSASPVDLLRVEALAPQTEDSATGPHWVASIAIAGFPAAINARANSIKFNLGAQVYTAATVLELPRFKRLSLDVSVDAERLDLDSAMIAVGNTRFFGGGMLACPGASHDDGLLHVTSIEGVGRVRLLRHVAGRAGGTDHRPEVLRRTGKRFEIHDEGVELWGDGEFIAMSPLSIEIDPGAIQVARSPTIG